MIHRLLLLGIIFLLLQAANLTEALSYLSRPMITGVASLFGIEALNRGTDIVLGSLVLPWTQDCSGVNTLIILWGITIWSHRQRPFDRGFILRLMLCVPAALLANLLRILTLAGYRYVFYPEWESEEVHYLVGFLWLLPFLFLFAEDLRSMDRTRWIEALYLSLVLALLAPAIFSPGGTLVALSSLLYLAHIRAANPAPLRLLPAYLAWGGAALLIAWSNMESLWIPWLLLCPRLVSWRLLCSWAGIIILSGTVSLLAMHPAWQIVVGAALAYRIYLMIRADQPPPAATPARAARAPEIAVLMILGMAPFGLLSVIGAVHPIENPPSGVMAKQLTFNSYQLRVTGQPVDIRMYWYGAFGDGRHHSLVSCMRFRGLILEPVPGQEEVFTEGSLWMRDFFIHEGEFKTNYPDYLLASASPFAAPGIHVIFDAPAHAMSAAYFSQESERLAKTLYETHAKEKYRGVQMPTMGMRSVTRNIATN